MDRAVKAMISVPLALVLVVGCTGASVPSPALGPSVEASPGPDPSPTVSERPPSTPGTPGFAISTMPRAPTKPADARNAAFAVNDFGLELLRSATDGDSNAVISPASIVLALGMARPGARGETAAEMDWVLREAASDDHASWLNGLEAALAMRTGTFKDRFNKDADVVLRIANTTFAQQDFAWDPVYLDALASRFGSGVNLVDYIHAPEPARLGINAWVGERTEHRIPELLPEGTIDVLTRIVLVNAVYLKAAWLVPFEKEETVEAPFSLLDRGRIDVPTMQQTTGLSYAAGDGWDAVELPYVGRSLAMLVIVPEDLERFEASLDGAAFAAIASELEQRRVALSMPRFGLESKLFLNDVLAQMGMPRAFDPERADFGGMTDAAELYITAVVHQANLDLDEEGTEASAATGVVGGVTSMPPEPVVVKVDRPFLFALRDVETGAILFLGRVVEPMERN